MLYAQNGDLKLIKYSKIILCKIRFCRSSAGALFLLTQRQRAEETPDRIYKDGKTHDAEE